MFWGKDERSAGVLSELILGGPGHLTARINGKAACRRCPYLYRYRSIVSGALVKILNPARVSSRFLPSPLPSPIEMSEEESRIRGYSQRSRRSTNSSTMLNVADAPITIQNVPAKF